MTAGGRGAAHRAAALLVLADGAVFEGEAAGAPTPVVDRRAGVQHRDDRLPGGDHRPSYAGQVIAFTYPHIGNYGANADRRRGARPALPRASSCATWPSEPSNWRSTEALEEFLRRHGVPAITGVDTRRLTRHLRDAGRDAVRVRHRGRGGAARGGGGRRRHRRAGPGVGGHRTRAQRPPGDRAARPPGGRGLRLRGQGDHAAPPVDDAGHRHRGAGRRRPADEVLALEPDGVFLSNGPGDPAALPGPTAAVGRPGRAGCRSSGSASATSSWPPPSAASPTSSPSATTAATTRCGGSTTGGSRSPARTTTTRWPPAPCRDAEITHVNLNDGVIEGLRCRDVAGLLRAVPPRGRAGAPRRPLPLRRRSAT